MSTTTTAQPTFRADRFRKLYEANVAVPEARFDMNYMRRDTGCGTVGCAFGNYAMAHPEEGVKLVNPSPAWVGGTAFWIEVPGADADSDWVNAVAAHLGIEDDAAARLFSADEYAYATKSNVLARLRAFAAERGLELPEYQGEGAGT